MQFSTLITTILVVTAAGVSANPWKLPVKKVTIKTTVTNAQSCGNGQATYCCVGKLNCNAVGE